MNAQSVTVRAAASARRPGNGAGRRGFRRDDEVACMLPLERAAGGDGKRRVGSCELRVASCELRVVSWEFGRLRTGFQPVFVTQYEVLRTKYEVLPSSLLATRYSQLTTHSSTC